jgi:hypothetical protein
MSSAPCLPYTAARETTSGRHVARHHWPLLQQVNGHPRVHLRACGPGRPCDSLLLARWPSHGCPPPWARTRSPAWATCQHPSGRPMILPTDPRERAPYARRSPGPGHVAVVERSGRGGAAVHGRLAGQPAGSPACTPVQPLSAAGHHPERIGCSGFGPQRPVLAGLSPATWHPMVRSAQGCSIPKGSPPTSPCL